MTTKKNLHEGAADLLEDWAGSQQQIMQAYLTTLAGADSKNLRWEDNPWISMWQQTLQASGQAFKTGRQNRIKWAHNYFQTIAANNGHNQAVTAWAKAMDDAVSDWAEAEEACWDACQAGLQPARKQTDMSQGLEAMQKFWQAYTGVAQAWLAMPTALATEMVKHSALATNKDATDKPVAGRPTWAK